MAKYRWTGDHAINVTVGDKIVALEPGGFVEGDLSSPDNEHLFDDGLLFDVDKKFGSGSAGTDSKSQPLTVVTPSEPAPAAPTDSDAASSAAQSAQPQVTSTNPSGIIATNTTKTTEGGDS